MAVPFPMTYWATTATTAGANPQLQYFENFLGIEGGALRANNQNELSFHAVNIPLSISFNQVNLLGAHNNTASRTISISFGFYSLTGSSFSLANSASGSWALSGTATSWISLATSATQNISPGAWWFGMVFSINSAGSASSFGFYANSNPNLANAGTGLGYARWTATSGAMPASVATSDLDVTGNDTTRQFYAMITA